MLKLISEAFFGVELFEVGGRLCLSLICFGVLFSGLFVEGLLHIGLFTCLILESVCFGVLLSQLVWQSGFGQCCS